MYIKLAATRMRVVSFYILLHILAEKGGYKKEMTVVSGQLSKWLKVCMRQFAVRDWDNRGDESRALELAHQEWQAANRLFDYASEPELVDYAIFSLQAAEKQYVYLWKKAKERQAPPS
jgi:hypothetical protein